MLRRLITLILFCLLSVANATFAQTVGDIPTITNAIKALRNDNQQRQEQITHLQNTLNQPDDHAISQDDLSEVRVALDQIRQSIDTATARISDIQNQLSKTQAQCDNLNAQLQRLANPLSNTPISDSEAVQTQFRDCQEQVVQLSTQLTLAQNNLQLMQRQRSLRENQYQRYNDRYLQNSLPSTTPPPTYDNTNNAPALPNLQRTRETLLNALASSSNRDERLNQNIELAMVGKQILLATLNQDFQSIDKRLQELQFADFASVSLDRITAVQSELITIQTRLAAMREQIASNMDFINQQYALYHRQQPNIPEHISERHNTLTQTDAHLSQDLQNAIETAALIRQTVDAQFTAQSKTYLQERFTFGNWQGLPKLGEHLATALTAFIGQYAVSFKTLGQSSANLSHSRLLWLGCAALIIIITTAILTSYANHLIRRHQKNKRLAFSTRLLLFFFGMGKYNLPYVGLLLLTWAILLITHLPAPGFNFILLIPVLFLLISIPHYFIHILTSSQLLASTDTAHRLGRPITIAAAIGGILLACVLMAQWTLSEQTVIDTFRWIYGIYILLISFPLWKLLRSTRRYLDEHYHEFYTYRILRQLLRIIPIGFLFFGIASVLGYLNLAWLVARYLLIALLYTLIWIGFLGLCKDLSLAAKRLVISSDAKNGVFWAQDVINPLHAIARYGSFIGLIYALLITFQWNANTPFLAELLALLKHPLLQGSKGSSELTLMNLILMSILIYLVFRIGNWAKSLCYRWVYAKVTDLGVRNSLAVFSQYAIVTLGFLLALRIIGIDLTAFTVFAGALGVGIGFGLQTIANNFISGILLLIERPLRNGDIISVGNYEGTVERIGMRSLTLTTFNNESVILPNSDFVTSAFRNWSHTDQIIRVVLYFDLSYRHDPQDVEAKLLTALEKLAADNIIANFGEFIPGVYAWNYSERGITYRAQFYVNMDIHGYLHPRHTVIRALWQACYDNGFEIAYPKTDLFFPEYPEAFTQAVRERLPQQTRRRQQGPDL